MPRPYPSGPSGSRQDSVNGPSERIPHRLTVSSLATPAQRKRDDGRPNPLMIGRARQCRAETSPWDLAPATQTAGVRFKGAAGLTLWPGHARPAPGAPTWTQRCGTGRHAPGRPGGGVCDEDSLKQCWRRDPKAAGSSNYPIGHDRRLKDPAPTAEWAGPRRGSGETGQRETVQDGARAARGVRRARQLPGRQQSEQREL